MNSAVRYLPVIIAFTLLSSAANAERALFEFGNPSDGSRWQIVNDGVMGGRSTSRATISQEGVMQFRGTLSLANNGGFASVRSRPSGSLGLSSGDTVVLRVRGDGRRYTFNLYTPDRRTAFSYQMKFDTLVGQWAEVRLPVDQFVAHSFGRPIRGMRLDPSRVQAVGVTLGDKRAGGFVIDIDSIRVE